LPTCSLREYAAAPNDESIGDLPEASKAQNAQMPQRMDHLTKHVLCRTGAIDRAGGESPKIAKIPRSEPDPSSVTPRINHAQRGAQL
jgi:hypothetical protein